MTERVARPSTTAKSKARLRVVDKTDEQSAAGKRSKEITQFTETWAADRLAHALVGKFCWVPGLGWMAFDGKRWRLQQQDLAEVVEAARQFHKKTYGPALVNAVNSDRKSDITPLKRLLSKSGIAAVVDLCKGILRAEQDKFDADPHLLNVQNGVVDLSTGELQPHDPNLMMTHITSVSYVPDATHPDLTKVLRALRPDARAYTQVRLGQAITGEPPDDDKVVFWRGDGENGKSTLINGLCGTLGSYYRLMADKVLTSSPKDHLTFLADFRGVRLAVLEELPEGHYLNATQLKKATGDQITANRMYKNTETFNTSHTLIVTSNYHTSISETDHGTWRRLERLTFPYTFRKSEEDRKTSSDRVGDAGLRDRVKNDVAVHEAILAWLVNGAHQWYGGGKVTLAAPPSIAADTAEWRMSSDAVLRYLTERLGFSADRHTSAVDIAADINQWREDNGHTQRWSAQQIRERLAGHDVFKQHGITGPKYVKASKAGLSVSPHTRPDGGWAVPTTGYQAWVGVYFIEDES